MKRILFPILFIATTLCLIPSCEKATDNGLIDGMWNLREIYSKLSTDATKYTEYTDCRSKGIYWRFQLNLLYITSKEALNGHTGETTARFNFTDSHLDITSTYVHYRDRDSLLTDPTTTELEALGIRGNATSYDVVRLTSHNLILRSASDSLIFHKL